MWAKQSTAAILIVGPILDSAGAEYASAVIGDLSLSKNGGTLTALAAAATLTHIANGQYTLVTTTGNLDTLGRAQITCNKSTYQMPSLNLMVVPAMVFDSMVLGTDVMQSDVTQLLGTAWLTPVVAGTPDVNMTQLSGDSVAADNAEAFFDGTGYAGTGNTIPTVTNLANLPAITANWLTAAGIAADAVTEIQSGLSTLTQTQVTGGSYALNSASFAFHTWMDFTTTQKAATLARVTLVDTTTTNTDMRGTNSALTTLGATAPANWVDAAALASDAVTEIQSGLATQANVAGVPQALLDIDLASGMYTSDQFGAYIKAIADNTDDWADGGRLDLILDSRASQTSVNNVLDGVAWLLADSTGAIAAPQSATATAVLTVFGSTYTVQYAGLTSTGVRTAPTLTKV